MGRYMRLVVAVAWIGWAGGCDFPRPLPLVGMDAATDGAFDSDTSSPLCAANHSLRCDGSNLVRCNGDGTAEVRESCSLGCSATDLRCKDVDPSNSLAPYLDMAAVEPALDLGTAATVNTDDGTILVDGNPVAVKSMTMEQVSAPTIRVFIVRRLSATKVTITGTNALAVVSHGDLQIDGIFAASGHGRTPGAGGYNDGTCRGGDGTILTTTYAGTGGGGFGLGGGRGGSATTNVGTAPGAAGGMPTGNPRLVPLRGGCDSGRGGVGGATGAGGGGGGAIQLVSRTKIAITGAVAVNGAASGGSGGGILLEAPIVEVSGAVVANGGSGDSGCIPQPGQDGRLDATPAPGGIRCNDLAGDGGDGGAGVIAAGNGGSVNQAGMANVAAGGHGGGGVGRVRINTISGGLHGPGVFSPNPTTGTIGSR